MTEDEMRALKQKRRNAGIKASETKGEEERSRAARAAAWTRKHGKDDATSPHTRENANPSPPPVGHEA